MYDLLIVVDVDNHENTPKPLANHANDMIVIADAV